MGLFGKFFGAPAEDGSDRPRSDNGAEVIAEPMALVECDTCLNMVSVDSLENGECEECANLEYSGPKYCCGAIYEDGEDTCRSCGEPL